MSLRLFRRLSLGYTLLLIALLCASAAAITLAFTVPVRASETTQEAVNTRDISALSRQADATQETVRVNHDQLVESVNNLRIKAAELDGKVEQLMWLIKGILAAVLGQLVKVIFDHIEKRRRFGDG